MSSRLKNGAAAVRTLGWRWAFSRAIVEAERRSGQLEWRAPVDSWDRYRLAGEPALRAVGLHIDAAGAFLEAQGPEIETGLRNHLERIKAGEFTVFGATTHPPSWHAETVTPADYPAGVHWTRVNEMADADLKLVWEPSRFGWAFDLARLHALDPTSAAPEVFWQLFEDWCGANQPNIGVNWLCGQEAAIRLVAVMFAVQSFGIAELSPQRRLLLAKFADATAARIRVHWRYAKSQHNNHIVSEAAGLVTVALLFPELDQADDCLGLGERLLVESCQDLVFPDGGTSQYSLNYHRLFMETFVWVLWLYQSVGQEPPEELRSALRRAHRFLSTVTDPATGSAGNWGHNDGAHLLPLSDSPHLDMRPTLLMAGRALNEPTSTWTGPGVEALRWFWGRSEHRVSPEPSSRPLISVFPDAGISVVANGPHRAIIRGGPHQLFRPSQCDFGHVELWVDGRQLVFDPGTWSYKPRPGEPDLSRTEHHNGPRARGMEQMTRLGRFLWADWPAVEMRVIRDSDFGIAMTVVGNGFGFERMVMAEPDGWRIIDRWLGNEGWVSDFLVPDDLAAHDLTGFRPLTTADAVRCDDYRSPTLVKRLMVDCPHGDRRTIRVTAEGLTVIN